jgi:hypothetical protein
MYTPMHSDALSRPTIAGGPVVQRAPEVVTRPLSDGTRHRKGRRGARRAARRKGSKARRAFLLFAMALSSVVGRR